LIRAPPGCCSGEGVEGVGDEVVESHGLAASLRFGDIVSVGVD
jgi:hypothetical protein